MGKDNFVEFLRKRKKQAFKLIVPPGNTGDELILKGFLRLCKKENIKLTKNLKSADNILILGGGNFDDIWECGRVIFEKCIKDFPNKPIIVGPGTYYFTKTDFKKILDKTKQPIFLFAREKYSYNRLKKLKAKKNIRIKLAKDSAFFMEDSPIIKKLNKEEKYVLLSFRYDKSSNFAKPSKTIIEIIRLMASRIKLEDLIRKYYFRRLVKKTIKKKFPGLWNKNTRFDDISQKDFKKFITIAAKAKMIHTDRLHVAILGAMMGKKVFLYKEKTEKAKGVYEYCLKEFPNVIPRF